MLDALGIVASYGERVVLTADRLSVDLGNRIAIIGASGSGKTTLLRVLAGLHHPKDGQVSCDGVMRWNAEHMSDTLWVWPTVTLVFQEPNLFPNLTARDNCLIGLVADLPRKQDFVKYCADRFDVGRLLDRRPWEMSQGQRQRFCLIRALARSPKYLLLDEPLSALDPETRDLVGNFLIDWSKELASGLALATHDWVFATSFATSFWAVGSGRVVRCNGMLDAMEWVKAQKHGAEAG